MLMTNCQYTGSSENDSSCITYLHLLNERIIIWWGEGMKPLLVNIFSLSVHVCSLKLHKESQQQHSISAFLWIIGLFVKQPHDFLRTGILF